MSDAIWFRNLYDAAQAATQLAGSTLRDMRVNDPILSLRDVTKLSGVDAPTLSRIENGHEIPTHDQLESILRVLQHSQTRSSHLSAVPTPRARTADPVSSQYALADMAADTTTKDLVDQAIDRLSFLNRDQFTDTDLTRWLADNGTPKPRNIVARYRGWAEEAGRVERVGCYPSSSGRKLVHFRKAT